MWVLVGLVQSPDPMVSFIFSELVISRWWKRILEEKGEKNQRGEIN